MDNKSYLRIGHTAGRGSETPGAPVKKSSQNDGN